MEAISVAIGRGPKSEGGRTYHDGEDALLHLARVLGAKNDHLHAIEVDLDGGGRGHALREAVRRELARVVNDEVGLAEVLELLFRRADEHVVLDGVRGERCFCDGGPP